MHYSVIIAVDSKNGIGKDGGIPWSNKEDMRLFREKTINSIVIMGRKTADSLARALRDRVNIVISRQPFVREGFLWFCSIEEADRFLESVNHPDKAPSDKAPLDKAPSDKAPLDKKIWIIGGAELLKSYFQSSFDIRSIHLTRIEKDYNCDTFFCPIFLNFSWNLISKQVISQAEPVVSVLVYEPDWKSKMAKEITADSAFFEYSPLYLNRVKTFKTKPVSSEPIPELIDEKEEAETFSLIQKTINLIDQNILTKKWLIVRNLLHLEVGKRHFKRTSSSGIVKGDIYELLDEIRPRLRFVKGFI